METAAAPKWTAAVYLAGGENVTREMIPGLHDLRDVTLANKGALSTLAQFEPGGQEPRLLVFDEALLPRLGLPAKGRTLAPTPTGLANYEHRIELPADGQGRSLALLKGFFERARAAAPEGALLVVISGHASGAVGELLGYRAERDPLHLPDLARALSDGGGGRRIDVLGMDCCCMSMVEVAYEVAPHARFLVASEGTVLNHGWPYREILEAVVGRSPREAASEIVRQYVGNYSDYSLLGVDADCAVTDLDDVPRLTAPMRRLTERLSDAIDDADVWRPTVLAHWEAQSYKEEEYVDLADFCDRLRIHVADPGIRESCSGVIDALGQVVGPSCVSGPGSQFSTGLSVYFPWCHDAVKSEGANGRSALSSYQDLVFSRETGWGPFLDAYLTATRRPPQRASVTRPSVSFEPVFVECGVSRNPQEQEATMVVKSNRVGAGTKGAPARASVKNHPCTGGAREGLPAVKIAPPWNVRGGQGPSMRFKNHPREPK
jgi:hypothetical protein